MRVMVDTNVIISALLFPASLPAKVLSHIAGTHDLILCEHIIMETRDVLLRKHPDLTADLDLFWAQNLHELVGPSLGTGQHIADPKDQPILDAATAAGVDIIISGDKHFLKLDMERPKTMSPADFWRLEGAGEQGKC